MADWPSGALLSSNFAHSVSTLFLWRSSVVPMADNILGAIAEGLRPWFPGATLKVAIERVAVLSEERAALWARIGGAPFLSDEEKRRILGIDA